MKKIVTLLFVGLFTLGLSAQNFGIGLDYAMWNGVMVEDAENSNSIVIGVNYTYNLFDKMDMVGLVGYGVGFGIMPIKADLKYSLTNKISSNVGVGMYMISASEEDYKAIGVDNEDASTNEFGVNLGLGYQVTDAITLGFNYNMIKSGDYDFNGMTFGLSYGLGNSSKKAKKTPKKKKAPKNKKIKNN